MILPGVQEGTSPDLTSGCGVEVRSVAGEDGAAPHLRTSRSWTADTSDCASALRELCLTSPAVPHYREPRGATPRMADTEVRDEVMVPEPPAPHLSHGIAACDASTQGFTYTFASLMLIFVKLNALGIEHFGYTMLVPFEFAYY